MRWRTVVTRAFLLAADKMIFSLRTGRVSSPAEGWQQLMGSPGERQRICKEPRLVFFSFRSDLAHPLHTDCAKNKKPRQLENGISPHIRVWLQNRHLTWVEIRVGMEIKLRLKKSIHTFEISHIPEGKLDQNVLLKAWNGHTTTFLCVVFRPREEDRHRPSSSWTTRNTYYT